MGKATDRVYNLLRRRIMAGHYAPHTRLKETAVAADLGVSRTPVRSALQRLVSEGLLRSAATRGALTVEWTERDVAEVFELRALLEGLAAAHAAERCSEEALAELRALTDEMQRLWAKRPDNHLALMQSANRRFHGRLLMESGCPRVRDMAMSLMDIPLVTGGFYIYTDADVARSLQHHRDLIDALTARDREWARIVMQNHLMASHQVFVRTKASGHGQHGPGNHAPG